MRWCRFEAGGEIAYGIIEGDRVVPVTGDPFGGYERASDSRALSDVRLLVPVIPSTFYAAGINFRYIDAHTIGIALNETVNDQDLAAVVSVLSGTSGNSCCRVSPAPSTRC